MSFIHLPYEREVWHYKLANSDCIQYAIANFDWEKVFHNVDVMLFNETVLNIIWNVIPQETIKFDNRDPPWITSYIRKMNKDKNLAFKRFVNKKCFVNNSSSLERFSSLQNKLSSLIETLKQEYFSKIAKKLSDSNISSKTYWSILKSFLKGKKSLAFLLFFMKINLLLTTEQRLKSLILSLRINAHWLKILVCFSLTMQALQINAYVTLPLLKMTLAKGLDQNKAHVHGMISIRMLKLCKDSIYKPL